MPREALGMIGKISVREAVVKSLISKDILALDENDPKVRSFIVVQRERKKRGI